MRVLFLTNVPAPYRVDFFNELGKLCDLTVIYELQFASNRNDKWINNNKRYFKEITLGGIRIGCESALNFSVIKYLSKKDYDIIVIGGYSTPTGMLAIEFLKLKRIPFILNCDGGFIKQEGFMKRTLKSHFISSANYWLSTGEIANKYLINYGARKKNIFIYPFTSLKKDNISEILFDNSNKNLIKDKLGIRNKKVLLAVGQFIHRKGFDVFINAISKLEGDFVVYIIGGKPTKEYIKIIEKNNIKNIFFEDFQTKEELEKYYKVADIFVLPTREDIWGLVINEAMSYGLPVITTDRCASGLELIKNDENGYIIQNENKIELSEKISYLLKNEKLRNIMKKNNFNKISKYTIENMAREHINIFKNILAEIENE